MDAPDPHAVAQPAGNASGGLFGLTSVFATPRLPAADMGKRSGPRRTKTATTIDVAMTFILIVMIAGGFWMIGWAALTFAAAKIDPAAGPAKTDPNVALQIALQLKGFAANLLLTGITTIYCGITGFILLENRRMRMQAIMPHVQVLSPVRSTDAITLEIQNAGAAPAVNVEVRAWVMKRVGGNARTPDACLFRGHRPALPATQSPSRMQLAVAKESDSGEFNRDQSLGMGDRSALARRSAGAEGVGAHRR